MSSADQLREAQAALRGGETARAVALCTQVLREQPDNPAALLLAGVARQSMGDFLGARPHLEALTRLRPDDAVGWVNLGTVLRHCGDLDAALNAYARAAAAGARGADFLFNVALLHKERGDYPHAHQLLIEARDAAPADMDIRLQLAQCCQELLRLEEAANALADWASCAPLDDARIAQVALQLLNLGDKRGSDAAVRRLQASASLSALARLRLAQLMERNNRVAEAVEALATLRASPLPPELAEEVTLLAGQLAQRRGRHRECIELLAPLADTAPAHRRHIALFPMAKSQQALGEHVAAWQTLQQAHAAQMLQLRRSHPEVAVHREPPLLITRRSSTAQDFNRWQATSSLGREDSPVFVVAFPRSGTTLLEQALDAHPRLVSMDEQPFLQQIVDRIGDLGVSYPHELASLDETQLTTLRDGYWSLVRTKVQLEPGQRLVDKNPLNLLRLSVIRRLFPAASILLAIRHPLDVVLSCYTQHFRAPEFALLCRDPGTLARGFRRCFDFWYAEQSVLQADVLEVRYEDLVADFAPGMRRIASFLQVDWHDAMAHPGAHARAKEYISTPSYTQVIEPVTTRAVGKWQPYRLMLAEATKELEPYLGRWNYGT